jgi:glycosyltransferase involved in cell wall biosynthesis
MKNLSILTPTVEPRYLYLNRLLFGLQEQITKNSLQDKIEIIVFKDNFENSIGKKRNTLLQAATGKFTCFVDDDDVLNPNYCRIMNDIIESNNDIQHIGFRVKLFMNGQRRQDAFHSIQFKGWYQNHTGYYRETTTLNPILSEISRSFPFPEKNNEEDKDWVTKIIESKKLIKEFYIDDYMYEYWYNDNTSLSFVRRDRNRGNQSLDWQLKDVSGLNVVYLT